MWKVIGAGVLFLAVMFGLVWLVEGNDFFLYKVFAPQYAKVQRNVYENTQSYVKGTIQDLRQYQAQYATAKDTGAKQAIASLIIHTAADYGEDRLPSDLQSFVSDLRNQSILK